MNSSSPRALVLRTAGTNCDMETVHALKTCGARVDVLHLSELLADPKRLFQYAILVVPGGFSYGDDVAAGKILANELKFKLRGDLQRFVSQGRLVIGVCNGFQVLVKAGLLPGGQASVSRADARGSAAFDFRQNATLTQNDSGRFQCEWVGMKKENSRARWLKSVPGAFELPIAHGEGKFVAQNAKTLAELEKNGQVVFRYSPGNPNGSTRAIAGICDRTGNVIGLMPHPERYITSVQHPAWTRKNNDDPTPGYLFWKSAVDQAAKI